MEIRATGLGVPENKAIQQENLSETARVAPFSGGMEAGGATVLLLFAMTSRLPNPRAPRPPRQSGSLHGMAGAVISIYSSTL